MTDTKRFRVRLAAAVKAVGRKAVARPDGEVARDDDSVSQGGLSKILSGRRSNPGIFTVKAIADAAGITVGELLGESPARLTQADRADIDRALEILNSATESVNEARGILVLLATRLTIEETPHGHIPSDREMDAAEEVIDIALGGNAREPLVNLPAEPKKQPRRK